MTCAVVSIGIGHDKRGDRLTTPRYRRPGDPAIPFTIGPWHHQTRTADTKLRIRI
jgi:hypothetical protein